MVRTTQQAATISTIVVNVQKGLLWEEPPSDIPATISVGAESSNLLYTILPKQDSNSFDAVLLGKAH
jgi:hypothetical protein